MRKDVKGGWSFLVGGEKKVCIIRWVRKGKDGKIRFSIRYRRLDFCGWGFFFIGWIL